MLSFELNKPDKVEILFGAGLRQAQTDHRKKIETIAGLSEPKNY